MSNNKILGGGGAEEVVQPAAQPAPDGFAGTIGPAPSVKIGGIKSPIATGKEKPAASGTHPNQGKQGTSAGQGGVKT